MLSWTKKTRAMHEPWKLPGGKGSILHFLQLSGSVDTEVPFTQMRWIWIWSNRFPCYMLKVY